MAGVVYRYDDTWACARILRNDVLDSLYGKAAKGVRDLLDFALDLYRDAAKAEDTLEPLGAPIAGLHPGPLRMTAANSRSELLRIAALQYSSLANLDKLDPEEDSDQAAGEEAAKRFSTDVRELITHQHPELAQYFQRTAHLIEGGEPVRFGYASPRLLAHFSVISPARSGAGLRDARGRLFELQNGKRLAGFDTAALISGFPADDDPTQPRPAGLFHAHMSTTCVSLTSSKALIGKDLLRGKC